MELKLVLCHDMYDFQMVFGIMFLCHEIQAQYSTLTVIHTSMKNVVSKQENIGAVLQQSVRTEVESAYA